MTTKQIPRDAQVIQAIMKDMGITEYEPRVVNQLLEFVYRYVTTVLDDAKAYANHAKKKVIDLEDVKLAVSMQMEQSFTTPPPREILMEVARSKNLVPLPSVKPHCGIRLPADCYCMTACNYRLKSAKKAGGKSAGSSSASLPKMSTLGGVKAVLRPSSPAVRVTTSAGASSSTTSTPRAVVKVTPGGGTSTPRIQITVPPQQQTPSAVQSNPEEPKQEPMMEARGIKREREDDDYDAA